jgi:hypothetical protein
MFVSNKKISYLIKTYTMFDTCCMSRDTHLVLSNLINVTNVHEINHLYIIDYDYNVSFDDVEILM